MINKAHEEMRDLMTEHITNTDRMNAFLQALASDTKYNMNQNQRKEIIKLYGVAAEIFEESLVGFTQKIICYLLKLLKENQDFLHFTIASATGKIVKFIVNKNQNFEEMIKQANMVVGMFTHNLSMPNISLQTGTALCLEQIIKHMDQQIIAVLYSDIATKLTDILNSRFCKSTAVVLECMVTLILQLNELTFDRSRFFEMKDGQEFIEAQLPVMINHV